LKIAIVGFGSIGKRHFKNITSIFDDEVIICSKRKDVPKNVKCCKTISDCLDEKPEAVFITNETDLHISSALKFAEAGCHLFIEKPLSNSLKDVKKLVNIVHEKKLISQMGCNLRFNPCLINIKKLLTDKKIGRIISFQSENGSFLPDWHLDEDYSQRYTAKKNRGGSVVLTSIHEIDYLYWFFGNISELISNTGKFSDLKITSDDYSSIFLKFNSGVVGEIHLDYFQNPPTRTCKIIGTKGTIFWNNKTNSVKLFEITSKKLTTILKLEKFNINKMYLDEIIHFKNCIKLHKSSINNIEQGMYTLKIALSTLKSSNLKKMVKMN